MHERRGGKNDILAFIIKSMGSNAWPSDPISNDESSDIEMESEQLVSLLYRQILSLRISIDKQHQIQSRIIQGNISGKIWVRYVRPMETSGFEINKKNITVFNYLRIFYAYLLAAVVISRIHHFDNQAVIKSIYHVKHIISDLFYSMLDSTDEDVMLRILSEGKGYLVLGLHAFSEGLDTKSINLMLDQAKDWVAMEEPSMPVVTMIETGEILRKKRIVIIDEPCVQLTDEQKNQFTDLESRQWYRDLGSFHQKLVLYYRNQILAGSCVIPSQLRAIIPLCKNAYKQTVMIQADGQEFKELNSYYHSATAAYVSHKDNQMTVNLTRLNLLQKKMNANADAMVMICLNSRYGDNIVGTYEWLAGRQYVADDSEIIRLTQEAARQLSDGRIYHAKICLNGFRMLEYNDYAGINQLIEFMKDNVSRLDPSLPSVVKLQELIRRIMQYEWEFTVIDYNVKGLDIIFNLTQAACLNNQIVQEYPDRDLKRLAVCFGCASGENRTGIAFYHNICLSILDYYQDESSKMQADALRKYVFDLIAYSQHTLVMTGHQGNTFGTEGIRDKSSGTFKKDHPKCQLVTKSSDIKALPATDANFNRLINSLNMGMTVAEKNPLLKNFLYYSRQLVLEAENQREGIIFIGNKGRRACIDVLSAVSDVLKHSSDKNMLENFSLLQEKFSALMNSHESPLPDSFTVLNTLLSKLAVEANNLKKIFLTDALKTQGIFKSDRQPGNSAALQSPVAAVRPGNPDHIING
jgi:hypothetical protein